MSFWNWLNGQRKEPSSIYGLSTTRYSAVFKRILEHYGQGATIEIDERAFSAEDVPSLLATWCTNDNIIKTRNFRLVRGGIELFGFHDHPSELWASASEESFVRELLRERLIRIDAWPPGKPPARP